MNFGKIIKFLALCLVVGLIFAAFGVGVEEFWTWVAKNAESGGKWVAEKGKWAIPYVLVGAGVLIPVYIVRYLVRRAKGRQS